MEQNRGLHRFAVLVSACTLVLIFIGGLVTSTDSGLAVPDWPLSYGQLFPPMVGGILYEHGHRMAAATVGILTVLLAIWLWKREPRKWVRRLGGFALLAVIGQGILGGITVLFLLPLAVSVGHAALAQIFLCLTVAIALLTSRAWQQPAERLDDRGRISLRQLSLATTVAIYLQILIGALMRHAGGGLAIPDFPLSFGRLIPPFFTPQILVNYTHRVGAAAVTMLVIWTAGTTLHRHRSQPALHIPAIALLSALALQLYLGAETVWSRRATIPTTAHVMVGALTLAMSLILTLTAYRVLARRASDEPIPSTQARTAME